MAQYHLIGASDSSDASAYGIEHKIFATKEEVYKALADRYNSDMEWAVIFGDEIAIDEERVKVVWEASRQEWLQDYNEREERRERETYEKLKAKYG